MKQHHILPQSLFGVVVLVKEISRNENNKV
jgi:hypothetical protein